MREPMSGLDYRLLGPLEVWRGGRRLAVQGRRGPVLLTALLLRRNEPVSVDELIEVVWGDARNVDDSGPLHTQMSRLRAALGEGAVIETLENAYVLRTEPGAVDADRFADALMRGRRQLEQGDPAAARETLDRGLGEWRGRPRAQFQSPGSLERALGELEELHLIARELRAEAALACGEDALLVPELERLAAEQPRSERAHALLMQALYRSGRHADALAAYRRLSAALDELGLQPGPELRRLEQRVLQHDPILEPARAAPPTVAGPPRPRPSGLVQVHSASRQELAERLHAERAGVPFLVYRDAYDTQRIVELPDTLDRVTCGRRPKNDIVLDFDREVSRLHAEFVRDGATWTVVDDDFSTNGTFLNGERIQGRAELMDGALVTVGKTTLLFRMPSSPDASEPTAQTP
jgi:DNA-binding SARP family transcriptional activator